MTKSEDRQMVERMNKVRRLVRVIEEALSTEGYTGHLEKFDVVTVMAALDLVYDGRARCLKTQEDIDEAAQSAMMLAGAVSHVSRVMIDGRDPGMVDEPEPVLTPSGVIRL